MKNTNKKLLTAVTAAAVFAISANVGATLMTYTDVGAFNTAVGALSNTDHQIIDFESQTANTVISAGSTIQGVTFNPSLESPFELAVRGIGGTSGSNTLGASDNSGTSVAQFAEGEVIDFVLSQGSHAFGMFFITSALDFEFFANDLNLTFAGTTLSNPTGTSVATEVNGQAALFLGIVDNMGTHTSASVQFGPTAGDFTGGNFFEIDDINFTTRSSSTPPTIPEPSTLALLGMGLAGIGYSRKRKTA